MRNLIIAAALLVAACTPPATEETAPNTVEPSLPGVTLPVADRQRLARVLRELRTLLPTARRLLAAIAGAGGIPFTDVPNGGTMSVRESLAIHAKERERAIAECNASPACQAEVRRRSAINSYFDCMKPLQANEPARTCYRPW